MVARIDRIEESMEVDHGRPRGCFHFGGPHKGKVCPELNNPPMRGDGCVR